MGAPDPAPKRVLLAEDEPIIALGMESKLRRLGYEVVATASDGEAALQAARDLGPDVLVLDIKMPKMTGLDVASRLAEDGAARPTVIITAYEDEDLVDRAVAVGVGAYLAKPVTEAQLGAAIKLAASRFAEFASLRSEIDDLREALEARKLIERAKGLLISRMGMTEEDAFKRIQKAARDRRVPMVQVARSVLEASELFSD